ncbi:MULTISPECIES: CDP-diacylglycerol--glycerol-3-phosphate 3-phosphatidyltransferase [Candidatus Ichthyocystis]|uniref:CDP-diacylglycerol--glycerol-3-phosphate 3-phosphatidyltransferase n=1 Tax=Candidatus Ichthyocystis hellenicum TaxID=1561003 RepID=A0A0S4M649_9BURK|nr:MULTISPECIES: CDP-diacylglycerol--glycerol-3-phosphate 3-phosphatidyltransferase [Ichthyocystis]CUT17608.1 CDP-diacylglycerol--glycerol-3-phosphate 3-phosphatidyltransferase [Candidatus Ichthyocystis hellenicum]
MMTLPNFLTFFRIILVPFFVICYCCHWGSVHTRDITATVIFTIAAVTDAFDGYFARILNQSSRLGSFLDPVADKLLVVSALCVLLHLGRLPTWIVIVIIGREITVSALREWMAIVGHSKSVTVCLLGKLKTVSQLSAIPLALANLKFAFFDTLLLGQILMFVAVVMTLISMIIYMCDAWPYLVK